MEEKTTIHCPSCCKILFKVGGLTENLEIKCQNCKKTYNVTVTKDGKIQLDPVIIITNPLKLAV